MTGRSWPVVDVVIPARNEREALPLVLADLPRDQVREIVVVDNGSSDGTADVAARAGASLAFQRLVGCAPILGRIPQNPAIDRTGADGRPGGCAAQRLVEPGWLIVALAAAGRQQKPRQQAGPQQVRHWFHVFSL